MKEVKCTKCGSILPKNLVCSNCNTKHNLKVSSKDLSEISDLAQEYLGVSTVDLSINEVVLLKTIKEVMNDSDKMAENLNNLNKNLRNHIDSLTLLNKQYKSKLDTVTKDNKASEVDITKLKQEITRLEKEITNLTNEVKIYSDRYQKLSNEKKTLMDTVDSFKLSHAKLEESYKTTNGKLKEEVSLYRAELSKTREIYEKLSWENTNLKTRISKEQQPLLVKVKELTGNNESLIKTNVLLTSTVSSLEETNKELSKENDALKVQFAQLEVSRQDETEVLNLKIEEMQKEHKEILDKSFANQNQLLQELEDTRNELEDCKAQLEREVDKTKPSDFSKVTYGPTNAEDSPEKAESKDMIKFLTTVTFALSLVISALLFYIFFIQ